MNNTYRPDIDGLRAFAVLAVVGFHAFPTFFPGGFIGVDVFFVISGYLITGVILNDLRQGTFSLWNFYQRRIRRIFPALLVVLATALVLGWFILFPDEYRALGKHVFGGAFFVDNFLLWREAGYFDEAAKTKPFLHLWSLGIEEQFYIVFPLLLWCCAKKHVRGATAVIAAGAVSFCLNLHYMPTPAADFCNPLTRAWELLAGSALCMAMRQASARGISLKLDMLVGKTVYGANVENDGRNLSFALALFGILPIGCALLFVRNGTGIVYPGWQAVLPVLGTMSLIAAGPSNPVNVRLLANRFAVFIGLVSYPFYLWHWVLISYAFIILGELNPGTRLLRIGLVIVSFVLSVLTYFLLEKPIRFGIRMRRGKIYALSACMVMVGVAGASVYLMDGLPERGNINPLTAAAMNQLAHLPFWAKETEEEHKKTLEYLGDKLPHRSMPPLYFTNVGSDETVAIIGDSHSISAYWGIAKLGHELHYNTLNLQWIIPAADKIDWRKTGTGYRENHRKGIPVILNTLKEKKDIKKVFICTRGMWYMRLIDNPKTGKGGDGHTLFKESLQSYVDTLHENGKEVFIISEIPTLKGNQTPRNYIARPFSTPVTAAFPELRKADVLKERAAYLQLLSEIRNATIIDAIEGMSRGKETIPTFTADGLPLYVDSNHLSFAGSDFLAEHVLRPYLERSQD